jgi:hypothetical protein
MHPCIKVQGLTDAIASCRLGLGFLLADVPNMRFMVVVVKSKLRLAWFGCVSAKYVTFRIRPRKPLSKLSLSRSEVGRSLWFIRQKF